MIKKKKKTLKNQVGVGYGYSWIKNPINNWIWVLIKYPQVKFSGCVWDTRPKPGP